VATLERHTAHQPPLCTTLPDHAGRRPGPAHRAEEGGGGGDHGATPPIVPSFVTSLTLPGCTTRTETAGAPC